MISQVNFWEKLYLLAGENRSSFDCPGSVHTMGSLMVYLSPLTEQIHFQIPTPECVAISLIFYASIEKHYKQCLLIHQAFCETPLCRHCSIRSNILDSFEFFIFFNRRYQATLLMTIWVGRWDTLEMNLIIMRGMSTVAQIILCIIQEPTMY